MNYNDLPTTFKTRSGEQAPASRGVRAIFNSLNNLLATAEGSLPGNPAYGCSLEKFLFEPIDPLQQKLISEQVRYSISRFEKRITIMNIVVTDDPEYNRILIQLYFRILDSVDNEEHDYIFKLTR